MSWQRSAIKEVNDWDNRYLLGYLHTSSKNTHCCTKYTTCQSEITTSHMYSLVFNMSHK